MDVSALQEELTDILSAAAELANLRASKVLSVRAEQHTVLDLSSFCELFNESWDFVVKSEVICRRMIVSLRGAIVSQVSEDAFSQPVYKLIAYMRHTGKELLATLPPKSAESVSQACGGRAMERCRGRAVHPTCSRYYRRRIHHRSS